MNGPEFNGRDATRNAGVIRGPIPKSVYLGRFALGCLGCDTSAALARRWRAVCDQAHLRFPQQSCPHQASIGCSSSLSVQGRVVALEFFAGWPWPTIRARKSNSSSTGAYFFGALDLTETPSRIATLRIRSGVRFIAFAICSSVLEARASSITRRSSLNDQPFRISRHSRPLRTKPPSGVYSPDGFATVGPDHGEIVR
jgi:hypothetical protein